MKTILNYILVLVITVGCKNLKTENPGMKIPIDYNLNNVLPFSESDYSYNVEIISLENLPEAYINFEGLQRLEVFENFYYIMSLGGTVRIFHKDGKYLTKIKKGRGPGEILMPLDISFDKDSKKLEVLDMNDIKIYDHIGNFENSVQIKNKYVEFVKFGDVRIFLDSNKDPQQQFNYIILNKKGELKYFENKYGPTLDPVISPRHFNIYDDELFLSSNYSNTIYRLNKTMNSPEKFAFIEDMNTDQSVKNINFAEYKKLCESRNLFTKIAGFNKMDNNLYQLSISKNVIKTYFFDAGKNKIYDHPLKDLPILFKPACVDKLDEYFLFPTEIINERIEKAFLDKNPELYSKLKSEMIDEGAISNLKVIHISYFRK